jgi:glutathione S-transferase
VWAARELGLEFTLVPVIQVYRLADPHAPDAPLHTASAAFRRVNPAAQIPSIDDDGFVLNESLAITMYLARKHGGPIAPASVQEEALILQWSLWAATSCETRAIQILYNSAPTGDPALRQAGIEAMRGPLSVLETAVAGGYLVGGRFTVADINVAEIIRYAQAAPELIEGYPAVKAWLASCQSRPAFVAMMAERGLEAV